MPYPAILSQIFVRCLEHAACDIISILPCNCLAFAAGEDTGQAKAQGNTPQLPDVSATMQVPFASRRQCAVD